MASPGVEVTLGHPAPVNLVSPSDFIENKKLSRRPNGPLVQSSTRSRNSHTNGKFLRINTPSCCQSSPVESCSDDAFGLFRCRMSRSQGRRLRPGKWLQLE